MQSELYTEHELPAADHEMHLTVSESPGRMTIVVPFPSGYPETPFRMVARHIARLWLTWSTEGVSPGVMLHGLYVHTHPSTIQGASATREERQATRGLGKRMLCLAIRTLTTEQKLSLETPLRLEACGGKCDESKTSAVLRCTSERELDAFLKRFPTSLAEFEGRVGRKATLEEKAEMKCGYDKRHALVKYYGQYGFVEEPLGPDGEDTLFCTPMITTLGAALRACDTELPRVRRR
jgi:hypothetical protein